MIPWFGIGAALLAIYGLYIGMLVAPTDFQQGDAYRIIYVHVRANGRNVYFRGISNGCRMGQANMGHMVGMGCATHI